MDFVRTVMEKCECRRYRLILSPFQIAEYLIELNDICHLELLLDKIEDEQLFHRIYQHTSILIQFRIIGYMKDPRLLRDLVQQERNSFLKIALLKQLGDRDLTRAYLIKVFQSKNAFPNSILEDLLVQLDLTQLAKMRLLLQDSYHVPLLRRIARQKLATQQFADQNLDLYFG